MCVNFAACAWKDDRIFCSIVGVRVIWVNTVIHCMLVPGGGLAGGRWGQGDIDGEPFFGLKDTRNRPENTLWLRKYRAKRRFPDSK